MLLKAADGVLEIIGAALLAAIGSHLSQFAVALTQHELSQDPRDFFANHILQAAHRTNSVKFGVIYLLAHGLVKIWLVAEVWRRKLWAYLALIVFTIGFMIYQVYRFSFTHSVTLVLLTLFDALIVYLTYKEYRRLAQRRS